MPRQKWQTSTLPAQKVRDGQSGKLISRTQRPTPNNTLLFPAPICSNLLQAVNGHANIDSTLIAEVVDNAWVASPFAVG